jgi:hypothetical protein
MASPNMPGTYILVKEYSCKGIYVRDFPQQRESCRAEEMSLRETWREVRGDEKSGFNFLDELAVGFGLVAHALPFRIVAEGLRGSSVGVQ